MLMISNTDFLKATFGQSVKAKMDYIRATRTIHIDHDGQMTWHVFPDAVFKPLFWG